MLPLLMAAARRLAVHRRRGDVVPGVEQLLDAAQQVLAIFLNLMPCSYHRGIQNTTGGPAYP